jgi:hypothetical protein
MAEAPLLSRALSEEGKSLLRNSLSAAPAPVRKRDKLVDAVGGFAKAVRVQVQEGAAAVTSSRGFKADEAAGLHLLVTRLMHRHLVSPAGAGELHAILDAESNAGPFKIQDLAPQAIMRKHREQVVRGESTVSSFSAKLSSKMRDQSRRADPAAEACYSALVHGAELKRLHASVSHSLVKVCAGWNSEKHGTSSSLCAALKQESMLLWCQREMEIVLSRWLGEIAAFHGGLCETRARCFALQAVKHVDQGELTVEELVQVAGAAELVYQNATGGVGPLSSVSSRLSPLALADAREKQVLAHLLHCLFHKSQQHKSLEGAADCLLQVEFYNAKFDMGDWADLGDKLGTEDGNDAGKTSLQIALQVFRPLLADKDSAVFLYFTGRLQRMQRPRPLVLVFTCSFGGGHKSASNAVTAYFNDTADVQVVDTSKDPEFSENDLLKRVGGLIGRDWDQTTLFNQVILKQQLYGVMNASESLGKNLGQLTAEGRQANLPGPSTSPMDKDTLLKRVLRSELLTNCPDLVGGIIFRANRPSTTSLALSYFRSFYQVVTVFHMHLNPILNLCQELGSLPLLHLSTGTFDVPTTRFLPPPKQCISILICLN